ncbi:hypothetical protein [Microtetraspora niveoalba]|uniref:hypothetical protein n=1 Tax=Microtetraspora niveoalba TaxID=46175 RepID=UPI000AAA41E8|nr:hypothetical protein [Microtetraspora niveoalba]
MHNVLNAATVTAMAAATTAIPAAAYASSPPDPAVAVAKRIRAGHGVKISESATITFGSEIIGYRVKGTFEFGKSGIAAADVTRVPIVDGKTGDKFHFRVVRGVSYAYGGAWGDEWTRVGRKFKPREFSEQNIDIFERATLRKLLTTTAERAPGGTVGGVRTTAYSGTVDFGTMYDVSPAFRDEFGKLGAKAKKTGITWRLWVDGKGLPRRLTTSWKRRADDFPADMGSHVTTNYDAWGVKVTITSPLT